MTEQSPQQRKPLVTTRRALIAAFVGATLANVGAVFGLAHRVRHRQIVVATLRKHLAGLGFADEEFERFARELSELRPMNDKENLLSLVWPVYSWSGLLEMTPMGGKLVSYGESTITQFLLATDWFEPGRERRARYLGILAPNGEQLWRNPLARLRESDGRR